MWRVLFLALGLTSCIFIEEKTPSPNILLIVADDLGFSDIGVFGGEISTPNLDQLAAKGMVLSNFHTGPTCSVSRSMLMSGRDNHIAGLGNMAETVADNQLGKVGYEGYLNNQVDTIAEVLKSAGYHTYMAGKWHLGMQPEQSPKHRGFDQSFALLYGGGSHFADMAGGDAHRNPLLYRNNGRLVHQLPEDFYSTTFYTDKLISQIDSNVDDGKPFFAYLAYTAPHWPLQAPREVINKYRGRYDQGYDATREARFENQKKLGLFDATTSAPFRPEQVKPWQDLSADEQRFHARNMEVYAAMVDYMDSSIGRIIHYLSEQGRLDNTLVVFISDNGAEHWNYSTAPPPVGQFAARFNNSPDNIGNEGSFAFYGAEWAHVSNTPYTRYKGTTYEGGIRSPAIVYWPGKTPQGKISPALTFITDWYATFSVLGSAASHQTTGKNLAPLLTGSAERVRKPDESVGLEVWGRRGILRESYKLVSSPNHPHGKTDWELYNLRNDPAERHNLIKQMPDVFAAMQRSWQEYVANNNVIVPEGPFKIRPPGEKPVE
ncbi:arylsulfatase [Pseudomaricurvus alkylphenolicus]|uniref:arylsulfatase n=1 Tax=Pseudomaricurvus alkylphenolicus TaxID=1306991 RepID=UPI0014233EAB|nr:arylsulfatase [Pseudomaricurvus alkylphenolicus]NIB38534.1 arylsulfatase [Pseudomaricurvus alkylphenolicus]